jgi:thiamine-phosphate pyrophosphorylase
LIDAIRLQAILELGSIRTARVFYFSSSRVITIDAGVYRLLDANCNRAMEGLRTLEDFHRFIANDEATIQQLKVLRHELAEASRCLDRRKLIEHRNSPQDVGSQVTHEAESIRRRPIDVVLAAANRTQQALRCLEEYGKLLKPEFADRIERLRYRAYDLFRSIELEANILQEKDFLHRSYLYVLVDCRLPLELFVNRAIQISNAGVDLIQIRDKEASAAKLIEYAIRLRQAIEDHQTRIVINDRVDIANLVNLGVHLGQDDLSLKDARRFLGSSVPIGLSTHDIGQARQAVAQGADYIGCGPTFPSSTKNFETFAGTKFLKQVSPEIALPAFAIGGITLERLDDVLEAGIGRVAVGHAIWHAVDPAKIASEFASRLRSFNRDREATTVI